MGWSVHDAAVQGPVDYHGSLIDRDRQQGHCMISYWAGLQNAFNMSYEVEYGAEIFCNHLILSNFCLEFAVRGRLRYWYSLLEYSGGT